MGRPARKKPLERHKRRWNDNIKVDLREVGGGFDWIDVAQDRDRMVGFVNAVMNLRFPQNFIETCFPVW